MVSEKMQGSARASRSRCVMNTTEEMSSQEETMIKYVCGIDIGSQSCAGCITRPDKSVVLKPITFANAREGWLTRREQRGYVLRLLHPRQTHHFHQQQGLRAKTDRPDAMTIARVLFSAET